MKKNKSNFRFDIILIFLVILLGPASGLLISKTNILDKYKFLNFLRPEVNVYEKVNFSKKHEIIFSSTKAIDLEVLLNQINLSYSNINSLEDLANFRLLTLPKDLSNIEPVSRRKNLFLSSILPLVVAENLNILEDRKKLCKAIKENNSQLKD